MNLFQEKISVLLVEYPELVDILKYKHVNADLTLDNYMNNLSSEELEDIGMNKESFCDLILGITQCTTANSKVNVKNITIKGGMFKDGSLEDIELTLETGSVTSIVGPTGSGKSRLLADIEWMAQRDTPTKRQILINSQVPHSELRFSFDCKLVAQLSQNMNFVIDTSVEEFIKMHIESRGIDNSHILMNEILYQANLLAGESFTASTPVTALSGGQSRALMIADTAILSASPTVLIDEIENAGIDRKKALDLLVKKEKIILIATHDPILALLAQRRIIIQNGGIVKLIETSENEKANLVILEKLDNKLLNLRSKLRNGDIIEDIELNF